MRGEDGVVGLDDGRRHLRGGVDHELQLGLARVIRVEPVHEEGGEPGSGSASESVEHDESLQTNVDFRISVFILGSCSHEMEPSFKTEGLHCTSATSYYVSSTEPHSHKTKSQDSSAT